jgi:hypothetical protein
MVTGSESSRPVHPRHVYFVFFDLQTSTRRRGLRRLEPLCPPLNRYVICSFIFFVLATRPNRRPPHRSPSTHAEHENTPSFVFCVISLPSTHAERNLDTLVGAFWCLASFLNLQHTPSTKRHLVGVSCVRRLSYALPLAPKHKQHQWGVIRVWHLFFVLYRRVRIFCSVNGFF